MKKTLLLLSTLLAFGMSLTHAQTDVIADLGVGGSPRRIIREQSISYYEESNSQGYFAYLPTFNVNSYRVKVPTYWSIRDFHVIGSTAYFCGTITDKKIALLGHFDISNLQSGLGSTTFYYDTLASILSILNRIAVSDTKGCISIMAIGSESPGVNPDMDGSDRVFYTADYASFQSCIFHPDNGKELFWDVVATDNYFATSGTIGLDTNFIVMRSVPIGSDLPTFQSVFSTAHIYTNTNNFSSGIRASRLGLDTIAFAAYTDSAHISWMQVFTINVPTAIMHHNQYSGMQYGIPSHHRLAPRDMVYLPDSSALFVVDTALHYSPNNQSILKLNPYPTTAYFPKFYFEKNCNSAFHSLVPLPAVGCMAASGDIYLKLDLGILPPPTQMDSCIVALINDFFIQKCLSNSLSTTGFIKRYTMSKQHKTSDPEPLFISSRCQHTGFAPFHYPHNKDIEKE